MIQYDKPNCPNSDPEKRVHNNCERKKVNGREAYVCPLCGKTVYTHE
jgi:transposase-like protein